MIIVLVSDMMRRLMGLDAWSSFESTAQRLRERCLGLPGASEEFPFGDEVSVFKVGGKMFALCSLDAEPPLQLSVKCDPELAVQLRSAYRGDRARVPPEQAALEHDHAGRLGARRDGGRPARRLLRPGGRVAAEGAQAVTAIPVRWLTVFLDFPAGSFGAGVAFWREVTGSGLSPFRGAAGEFATLLPPDGDAYLRVQRIADGSGGHHLDLHVDPAARVGGAGGRTRGGAGGDRCCTGTRGLSISASPGGFTFCLVRWHGEGDRAWAACGSTAGARAARTSSGWTSRRASSSASARSGPR